MLNNPLFLPGQSSGNGIDEFATAVDKFAATCDTFDTTSLEDAKKVIADLEAQLKSFGESKFNLYGNNVQGSATPLFLLMAEDIQILKRELYIAVHSSEWVEFQEK